MSEYQRIAFRAIDRPVSEENLDYMRQQSSRAQITPWSFDNEYQFGDFHGDADEMLRRGYDLHLHYADFGIRTLLIRFPQGLPDAEAAAPYFGADSVRYLQDKNGPGGILSVNPSHEPGSLDGVWEFDATLDRLLSLRAEIVNGDLRPLYLAHLAIARDGYHDPEETVEAPVPAGLEKLTDAQHALAELYQLSDALIAAAAEGGPSLPAGSDPRQQHLDWLRSLPQATKDAWLAQWMADPHSDARTAMLMQFRNTSGVPTWPTVRLGRTMAELETRAKDIQVETDRMAAEAAKRERATRLATMAADPAQTLRETEQMVSRRGSENYRRIAELLADLREALAGTEQKGLAEKQAQKLKKKNPTLSKLTGELRRKGFVQK